jgi:dUTP pyrophosphatase
MDINKVKVRIRRLPGSEGLPLPAPASTGASGLDLLACVDDVIEIRRGESVLVPTGLCAEIPRGYEAQVRPRSGLALRNGITILNTPGTIDSDYRGEIGVILINHGSDTFAVRRGDRIAQLVFSAVCDPVFEEVDSLEDSARGPGGFGHTGI